MGRLSHALDPDVSLVGRFIYPGSPWPPFFIGIYRLVKEFHHVLFVRFVIIQKGGIFQLVVHFQGLLVGGFEWVLFFTPFWGR